MIFAAADVYGFVKELVRGTVGGSGGAVIRKPHKGGNTGSYGNSKVGGVGWQQSQTELNPYYEEGAEQHAAPSPGQGRRPRHLRTPPRWLSLAAAETPLGRHRGGLHMPGVGTRPGHLDFILGPTNTIKTFK